MLGRKGGEPCGSRNRHCSLRGLRADGGDREFRTRPEAQPVWRQESVRGQVRQPLRRQEPVCREEPVCRQEPLRREEPVCGQEARSHEPVRREEPLRCEEALAG